MAATAKLTLSQDHLVTLRALEVLKLIADRLEKQGSVDPDDIYAVLQFFRDVAHRCLENTEKSLLVPFVTTGIGNSHRDRLVIAMERHNQANVLLDELERGFGEGRYDEFIITSRRYTTVLGDLIFDEDRFLPPLIRHLREEQQSQDQVQEMVAAFDQVELGIADQARTVGRILHQLEAKYVSPHCI